MTESGRDSREIDYGDRGTVVIVSDADALAFSAALHVEAVVNQAASAGRPAFVALSGGSTPKRMGQILASPPFAQRVRWDQLIVFWGDERWVPLDDAESNAGEAKRGFLDHVPVPADRIHVFDTRLENPELAAEHYERTIKAVVPAGHGFPTFDLILLGMGDDGHTASLFPGTSAVHAGDRLVVANPVPKMDTTRLTFTPPIINAARQVTLLVGGGGKAEMLHTVLDGPVDVDVTPSQIVRPNDGSLVWIVDEAAATHLDRAAHHG